MAQALLGASLRRELAPTQESSSAQPQPLMVEKLVAVDRVSFWRRALLQPLKG